MAVALRQISDDTLHALAVVLSLPPGRLERIGTQQRAKPDNSWLAEQAARIPGLPACLQLPSPPSLPHLSVKVAQVAKRVIIAVSGGADTVAAKAASKGISLDSVLHPCATPTVLCPAHRALHPTLMREIFFYISREVADHADFIRRHPCDGDDNNVSHNDNCSRSSREVHEWGLRMMGISALWCTPHTFRALEKGRQASVPGYRRTGNAQVSSSSASTATAVPAPHIRPSMRQPHLAFPCEACVVATVGARSQSLIDLRASMLSRMAQDASDKVRRAQRKGQPFVPVNHMERPERYPNLWALVDKYIDLMGNEYGEPVAAEMRLRSVTLAQQLVRVRECEARRQRHKRHQRHRARAVKTPRAQGQSTRKVAEKRLPRMVTDRGHRLPLPLVPPDDELWAHYNASVVGDPQNAQYAQAESVHGGDGGDGGAPCNPAEHLDELYFVVQDSTMSLGQGEEEKVVEEVDEQDTPEIAPPSVPPVPSWEEDYRRNVLESETVFSCVYDRPPTRRDQYNDVDGDGDEDGSYVTISMHTEQAPSRFTIPRPAAPPSGRAAPRMPTIPGTPMTSARSNVSRSPRSASVTSTASSHSMGPLLPPSPPLSDAGSLPPAPASSVYSQSSVRPTPSAQSSTSATKTTCKTVVSSTRPSLTRHTSSSMSRSRESSVTPSLSSRPPSTAFVPPLSVRTPTTPKSYVALQADLEAAYTADSRRTTARSTTARSPLSRVSTSQTSKTSHLSKTTRTTQATLPSTAGGLSRDLTVDRTKTNTTTTTKTPKTLKTSKPLPATPPRPPPKTTTLPYKAPSITHSMAQKSAIPTPLFSPSRHAPSSQTRKPQTSTRTPQTAQTPPRSNRPVMPSPARAPVRAPAFVAAVTPAPHPPSTSAARTALWAASTPSTFCWSQPPSLAPSLADDACSLAPEDSISVVATQRFMENLDAQARRQPARGKGKETSICKEPAVRNLNHYQPANSRRPQTSQAPASSHVPRTTCRPAQGPPQGRLRPSAGPSTSSASSARPSTRPRQPAVPRTSQLTHLTEWPGPVYA